MLKRSCLSAIVALQFLPLPTLAAPANPPQPRPTSSKRPPVQPPGSLVVQPPAKKITTVEGITEYHLDNGLRVLLFPDASSAVITVNLTYLVGSRHEGYGETGMAHLLEHLLFKGSSKHKNIPQELSEHGARPNGTTWLDRTNYFETFQASDKNLEWALSLESDRMVNSFIAKKDLDSEMTVVRNEFEAGENDPGSILSERVSQTAYLWHNYGHPTIGARSDIEKVPIERLQAFYRRYYQPDNAVLVVAGKIDEAKTLKLVQNYFGSIPRPTRKLIPTYTEEPTQDGERTVTLRRVGDSQAVITSYHIPPGSHPDYVALDVLSQILGDSPSGRLYKALVDTGKAASVGAGAFQLREPGYLMFLASLRKEANLQGASDILVNVVEDFAKTPPTAEEVQRAKTALQKQIDLTFNSSERLALQLSEWEAMGDWRHFFLYRDRLAEVKAEDVQRVAREYLLPSNRTLGLFVPTDDPKRAKIPWVADPKGAVKGYKGRPPIAAGEAFAPTPANLNSRDQRKVLPGGMKLATLEKKTRGKTVHFTMALRLGSLATLRNCGPAPDAVAAMMMRGTAKHTRAQLQDEFDRLKAAVSIDSSAGSCSVSVETVRENLPEVLKLVLEILREPSFDAKEFATWKQQVVAALEEERSDPETLSSIALNRHVSPYPADDPRHTDTLDEEIQNYNTLTLEQIKDAYQKFYGASTGEIAVVGDFDRAEVEKILEQGLSSWKSPIAFERMVSTYFEVPAKDEVISVKDKANAVLRGSLNLKIRDDDPDYPAMVMANYILGGGFLNSRLATRVRQKEGLSYSIGSSFGAGSIDQVGSFGVYAIFAPQNAAKVQTAIKEEIERALKDGFTSDELEKAKSGYLQSREGGRSKDGNVAANLLRYQFLDRRYTWDEEFEKKIRALTPEQLNAALRKHIQLNKMTFVKAGEIK